MSKYKVNTVQSGTHITDTNSTAIIEVPIDLATSNFNVGQAIIKLDKAYFTSNQISLIEKRFKNSIQLLIKDL